MGLGIGSGLYAYDTQVNLRSLQDHSFGTVPGLVGFLASDNASCGAHDQR